MNLRVRTTYWSLSKVHMHMCDVRGSPWQLRHSILLTSSWICESKNPMSLFSIVETMSIRYSKVKKTLGNIHIERMMRSDEYVRSRLPPQTNTRLDKSLCLANLIATLTTLLSLQRLHQCIWLLRSYFFILYSSNNSRLINSLVPIHFLMRVKVLKGIWINHTILYDIKIRLDFAVFISCCNLFQSSKS